jgi:hypothetical protein
MANNSLIINALRLLESVTPAKDCFTFKFFRYLIFNALHANALFM